MKIYTKTGDAGETGLFAGPRVSKDDVRIEAFGTVDELNAVLGLARSTELPSPIDEIVVEIQHELFALGAALATPEPAKAGTDLIGECNIARLERLIDEHEAELAPLRQFILPAGHASAAHLHVARSVCRRAERRVVTLQNSGPQAAPRLAVQYLNRLGDLLFVLARRANGLSEVEEEPWRKPHAADAN